MPRQPWATSAGPGASPRSLPANLGPATPQPQTSPLLHPHHQQQQQHNALGYPLDDDEDYVIIDGPSPFSSGHGSMCAFDLLTVPSRWLSCSMSPCT
jgi:hypothetical protein